MYFTFDCIPQLLAYITSLHYPKSHHPYPKLHRLLQYYLCPLYTRSLILVAQLHLCFRPFTTLYTFEHMQDKTQAFIIGRCAYPRLPAGTYERTSSFLGIHCTICFDFSQKASTQHHGQEF